MDTSVENLTADALALPLQATALKQVNTGRLRPHSICCSSRFLLEETDCGFQGSPGYDTDLFGAIAIKCFLQHFRFSAS